MSEKLRIEDESSFWFPVPDFPEEYKKLIEVLSEKLLELARKHFPEYKIVRAYGVPDFLSLRIGKSCLDIEFNLPENMTVKEYYEFLDNLPKKTPFYSAFVISFQFLTDTDPIPPDARTIPVWTKDENFLKEWRKILEETDV